MGIRNDYRQAVKLAKEGEYHKARSLLIEYDHPKTNALLDKINAAITADNKPSRPDDGQKSDKDDENKDGKSGATGCIALLAAIILCSVWIGLTPDESSNIDSSQNTSNLSRQAQSQGGTTPQWLDLAVLAAETESMSSANVDVLSATIVDGRANGGERIATIAFTTDDDFAGMGAVIGAVGTGAREFDGDIDSILMVLGPNADTVSTIATASYNDVIAFLDNRISVETLYSRMTVDR